MNPYLQVAGLEPRTLAGLLGVNPTAFEEWAADQRSLPASLIDRVASVLGVKPEHLHNCPRQPVADADILPAIWFRFRGEGLTDADRELVVLIRELALRMDELDEVLERDSLRWTSIFLTLRTRFDASAPPRRQGRSTARVFRSLSGLDHGQGGVGSVLRGWLRSMGVLVVESPLPESRVEGCSFFVGEGHSARPVIFANSAKSSWFRRNMVLMHELAHAIFDAAGEGATLDFKEVRDDVDRLSEERADAFAQEVLVPKSVLRHVAGQQGTKWERFDKKDLAQFVAATHVEQRVVLKAASEAGLLTAEQVEDLKGVNIARRLKKLSSHALSKDEYFEKYPEKKAEVAGKRMTTLRSRRLLLPFPYVDDVWRAWRDCAISEGRAAEMLMIARDEFRERFGESRPSAEEL